MSMLVETRDTLSLPLDGDVIPDSALVILFDHTLNMGLKIPDILQEQS